ncbi:Histone deacetylase-like amidohydrolase [Candidatus Entotheonellaceae bacterium PAL068K]
MDVGLVYHPDYLKHHAGDQHPERPSRLEAIMHRLETSGQIQQFVELEPDTDAQAWVATVHAPDHIRLVQEASQHGRAALDPDTIVCRDSFEVALKAVAGTLAAADAVVNGRVSQAFCAVRPPGHHATSQRAMGFCLFNTVAILARYLQQQHGLDNILVIDWDVHHGNGTQHIFENDPSVLYFSTHQYPFYPGTGAATETGHSRGQGYTLNVPLPANTGDATYIEVFEQQLLPRALEYRPDCVLISAGFDAHYADPLAQMQVTEAGYRRLTQVAKEIAATCCQHRLISVLEGGYNLEALGRSVQVHLEELQQPA